MIQVEKFFKLLIEMGPQVLLLVSHGTRDQEDCLTLPSNNLLLGLTFKEKTNSLCLVIHCDNKDQEGPVCPTVNYNGYLQ